MKRSLFFHAVNVDQVNSLKEHSYALLGQIDFWLARYSDREVNMTRSGKVDELIKQVHANIISRDQLNNILQEQVNLLMKDPLKMTHQEQIILPGQILQNEIRIHWEALRKQYQIVLDRPVGYYHQYINDQLKLPVPDFAAPEMSYG